MPLRPCLDCGTLHRNPSRCDTHQAQWEQQHERQRGSASARGYDSAYRKNAAVVMAKHRREWPGICPGWQREPHLSDDLTVDHIVPLSQGGTNDHSNLQVLCRPCNSAKHNH